MSFSSKRSSVPRIPSSATLELALWSKVTFCLPTLLSLKVIACQNNVISMISRKGMNELISQGGHLFPSFIFPDFREFSMPSEYSIQEKMRSQS